MAVYRCDICAKRATKALRIDNRRMILCKRCCRQIVAKIKREGISVVDDGMIDVGSPSASLMDHLEERDLHRRLLRKNNIDVVFLWLYPADDWPLAVESGTTDRPSYQDYYNAFAAFKKDAESQGCSVIVINTRLSDFLDEMKRRGIANTPENRTRLITEIGLRDHGPSTA